MVIGCGALQVAAPSVAEHLGLCYVHVHFCPITLPSRHHAPPRLPGWDVDPGAADALGRALEPHGVARAAALAGSVRTDGARVAAERLGEPAKA